MSCPEKLVVAADGYTCPVDLVVARVCRTKTHPDREDHGVQPPSPAGNPSSVVNATRVTAAARALLAPLSSTATRTDRNADHPS